MMYHCPRHNYITSWRFLWRIHKRLFHSGPGKVPFFTNKK